MAGLSHGTIPSFYREVYDVVCPGSCTKVPKEAWLRCLRTSSLSDTVLQQIWEVCDPTGSGNVGRDGLYKSLALAALAQQGKGIDEKALHHYGESELPSPSLAPIAEMRDSCMKLFRATRPTELGYTYEELKSMDEISVTLIPEKKGVVFKHVEYLVESKNLKSSVRRRYRDFEAFHEVLVAKYPYRLVPRMPPKKLAASSAFIEQRRRAMKRFLLLISRHPVLARDEVVKFFLSASGHEIGTHLKEKFKNCRDEFMFNEHAQIAEDLVSDATRIKFDRVREQITTIHRIISSMLQIAHNMENRSVAFSRDLKQLSSDLVTLATDSSVASSWTSGSDETWSYMKSDCSKLADKFTNLSEKALQQGVRETSGYTESVNLFLDQITAYQDLCERREKVQRRHQKALAKMQTMVSYKGRLESQGKHLSEKDDSRIIRRDDELILIEKRNFFSLFCMDLEAQLIHVNLSQLPEMFEYLTTAQIKGHTEYLSAWEEVKVVVNGMTGGGSRLNLASPPPEQPLSTLSDSGGSGTHHTYSPFV